MMVSVSESGRVGADAPFAEEISRHVWETKYRYRDGDVVHEHAVADSWRRVARAAAGVERRDPHLWAQRFEDILHGFRFLPGGRILAGAGTAHCVTLFNCFVMGVVEDSLDGIFDGLKEGALTMQQGGGVGYDFSTLRPAGTPARSTGTIASGPLSFMRVWDSMCGTLLSTGVRRGAMMATLRCDHPDVEAFVEAKRDRRELRRFNLSVQVTDAFMHAVRRDAEWPLVFPETDLGELDPSAAGGDPADRVTRTWTGRPEPVSCRVFRRVRARALWDRIMRATYECAEPGVLFIDRINRQNNLYYREQITATNPCGELPLPPYGACNLGSINVAAFVQDPFSRRARLDLDAVASAAAVATRFLDDVIDLSGFPLPQQAEQARGSRRIGLGLTGLADALIMLGLPYHEPRAVALAADVMRTICHAAYRASVDLARERGPFPFFDRDAYLEAPFIRALPDLLREAIAQHGIRNSHLTAIAPTGTISLLANNVSGGVEPVFSFRHVRDVLQADGTYVPFEVTDHAYRFWHDRLGPDAPLPEAFVDAGTLAPRAHLAMQAALQPFVDSAISKTINIPENYPFDDFRSVYEHAYDMGLKGVTTFRPNPVTGSILHAGDGEAHHAALQTPHCCSIEREAD